MTQGLELLTPSQMAEADRATIAAGTPGIVLMERAGRAVAQSLLHHHPRAVHVALLAGPGNNGGDAFIAARILAEEAGLRVSLHLLGAAERLTGDAAMARDRFGGPIRTLAALRPRDADVVVDGLFGAGLARAVEGEAADAVDFANAAGRPILAIDLPSGVSGLTGEALGAAIRATRTITFFRRKPGHLLMPGRRLCGAVEVADIGIDARVLAEVKPQSFANEPALWRDRIRAPQEAGHKFDRGHAVVFSGGATKTGAARMSAMAALRIGAGLVTVAAPSSALLVHANHLTAVMLERCGEAEELRVLLEDERLNAFVLGPAFGIGERARDFTAAILAAGRSLVLDADGLSSFREAPDALFTAIAEQSAHVVLTPHEGEFTRLFPDLVEGAKTERARAAARRSRAVVLLKGTDTVIAAPDSRAAINATGTPYLATAGSGDVLAGMIGGLLAQGAPAFDAACAAAWMHGMAGRAFGPGLIAEDLPGQIPGVLRALWGDPER